MFLKAEFSESRRTRSPRCAGAANGEFRDLAPSPIDRWGSKLALSGSDSASPPVAYSPNSRNSPTVCPGTPGGTLAIESCSCDLHAPLCGIFCPNSAAVARYGALIRTKSPTNCDAHLAESLFQTRSRSNRCPEAVYCWNSLSAGQQASGLHLETAEFQSTSIGQNSLPTSVKKYRFSTFALPVTSEFTMYIHRRSSQHFAELTVNCD